MNTSIETDGRPRHECGIFGVFNVPDAAKVISTGLFALQHRGQEGAGIATGDREHVRSLKGLGLLTEAFANKPMHQLTGDLGIGHVRYSTTGASKKPQNVQPLVVECIDGIWAIAHNGNLINAQKLRASYQQAGAIFQTSTDSEILLHLIADPMYRNRPRRVERALGELSGAFSFLLMTKDSVMAVRDPMGFRPLSIGKLGDGYVFSSETCGLDHVGATFVRDVMPGELVVVDDKGIRSSTFCEPVSGSLGQCIFEHVYFARPDSFVFGNSVHESRMDMGRRLAEEAPVEADMVIPIPDSGGPAALGYSQASGIPLDYGFIRNHYIGRTFIMPTHDERNRSVDSKLAVMPHVVTGKRIVVVDDSIMRGNTAQRRMQALRHAGATEIHLRIACPPTRHPCFFGVDFPSSKELIASEQTVEGIRDFVGADSLAYLSLEGLKSCVDNPTDYCTGCYTGNYPLPVDLDQAKNALEQTQEPMIV